MSFDDGFMLGLSLGGGGGGSGGGDEWEFPEHWPTIPEPAPNQVILYHEVLDTSYCVGPIQFLTINIENNRYVYSYGGGTIDWGDGFIETVDKNDASIFYHQYDEAKGYVITITANAGVCIRYSSMEPMSGKVIYINGENYGTENQPTFSFAQATNLRAAKISMDTMKNCGSSIVSGQIKYIKIYGEATNPIGFSECKMLEKIEYEIPPAAIPASYLYQNKCIRKVDCLQNVLEIPQNAFYQCTGLESVNPLSATSIGKKAFYECTALKSINAPNVTSIDNAAFYHCYNLTSVNLGSITEISNDLGYGLFSVENFYAPNLTKVANNVFIDMYNLRSFTVAPDFDFSSVNFDDSPLIYPKPQ